MFKYPENIGLIFGMNKTEIENLEIDILLDAIYKRYGYDFRNYARASLKRRIYNFVNKRELNRPSEIIAELLHNEQLFNELIFNISVTVTEMFRDPTFYKAVREKVVPHLRSYPFLKIWHAGCASGEEVYSFAILLKEENLYDRCKIYATDFNDQALDKAKEAIYPVEQIKKHTKNYQKAGGKNSFSDYYHSEYESGILDSSLKKNITFANHNLVSDSSFGEMNIIICRNVLIYFNKSLQNHVLNLFDESLIQNGFLCMGSKESLMFSEIRDKFSDFEKKEKVFKKN